MFVIGELINGMYKNVAAAIREKDGAALRSLARQQVAAGADALDLNCGPASADPVADMRWLVETVQQEVPVMLSLDSTKPAAIEEGLKAARNRCLINSSSADKEKLQIYIPLAKKYGACLIALMMDRKGVPQDKDRRLELAAQILESTQDAGLPSQDVFLDPILLPVNVAQSQLFDILEVIRECRLLTSPAPKTVVGLSNISQGAKLRRLLNRTFLVMAQAQGLDAAILDPLDRDLMEAMAASELILNKTIYCDSFVEAYRKSRSA
jgi:5-methyltetrahydrofolate corrinoid/iron sulfur protein methyltransferase